MVGKKNKGDHPEGMLRRVGTRVLFVLEGRSTL